MCILQIKERLIHLFNNEKNGKNEKYEEWRELSTNPKA